MGNIRLGDRFSPFGVSNFGGRVHSQRLSGGVVGGMVCVCAFGSPALTQTQVSVKRLPLSDARE